MSFMTDKQRADWPQPADGWECVAQELDAWCANTTGVLATLRKERRDPSLQEFCEQELDAIKVAREALAAAMKARQS